MQLVMLTYSSPRHALIELVFMCSRICTCNTSNLGENKYTHEIFRPQGSQLDTVQLTVCILLPNFPKYAVCRIVMID